MGKEVDLIGKEKYFVHKGTWDNGYQWRIQKVKITGLVIDAGGNYYATFSFGSCGYKHPISLLSDTLDEAKRLAINEIKTEKSFQIKAIKSYKVKE